jgi:hypothetical protein
MGSDQCGHQAVPRRVPVARHNRLTHEASRRSPVPSNGLTAKPARQSRPHHLPRSDPSRCDVETVKNAETVEAIYREERAGICVRRHSSRPDTVSLKSTWPTGEANGSSGCPATHSNSYLMRTRLFNVYSLQLARGESRKLGRRREVHARNPKSAPDCSTLCETKQLDGEDWTEPVGHGFKSRPPYSRRAFSQD